MTMPPFTGHFVECALTDSCCGGRRLHGHVPDVVLFSRLFQPQTSSGGLMDVGKDFLLMYISVAPSIPRHGTLLLRLVLNCVLIF